MLERSQKTYEKDMKKINKEAGLPEFSASAAAKWLGRAREKMKISGLKKQLSIPIIWNQLRQNEGTLTNTTKDRLKEQLAANIKNLKARFGTKEKKNRCIIQ